METIIDGTTAERQEEPVINDQKQILIADTSVDGNPRTNESDLKISEPPVAKRAFIAEPTKDALLD